MRPRWVGNWELDVRAGGTPDPAPGRDGLRVTREHVSDVAASWSFSDTALLTDAMRRLLGIGPTAYRAATQRR
jgi:AraC-like DNA-binding protein